MHDHLLSPPILILYRRCSSESVFTHSSFYSVRFRMYTNSSFVVVVFSLLISLACSLVHLFISFHILFYCKFSVSMSNRFTHTYSHHWRERGGAECTSQPAIETSHLRNDIEHRKRDRDSQTLKKVCFLNKGAIELNAVKIFKFRSEKYTRTAYMLWVS